MMLPVHDAHLHLQDRRLHETEGWPFEWMGPSIQRIVVNATCENDWEEVSQLSKNPRIQPAFGLHPWKIVHRSLRWKSKLRSVLQAHPNALVGEVGIDKSIRDVDFEQQKEVLSEQLDIALELKRVPCIHCVRAWGHLEKILLERAEELKPLGFLLHSYAGPAEMVKSFSSMGAYFSVSGYFAHPSRTSKLVAWKQVPMERLLVETDAPDMALPESMAHFSKTSQGEQINLPVNIHSVYEWVADQWGIERGEFHELISANFYRLFGN
jgi:TatD DNase family protein